MSAPVVRTLDEAVVEEAARVLSSALADDPIIAYVLPDEGTRFELGVANFLGLVRFGVMFGLTLGVGEPLSGVLVAQPPGADIDAEKAEASGLRDRVRLLGRDAVVRQGMLMDHLESAHRHDLPREHWYVSVIGVLPTHQGRGIGTELMGRVIEDADTAGLPCYLDTSQPRNGRFFTGLGFEVHAHSVDPDSGLPLWTYVRHPAPMREPG